MHSAAGAPGAGHTSWPPGVAEWTSQTHGTVNAAAASLAKGDGEEAKRSAEFIIQVDAKVA
eukprot:3807263-Pyramimonas_sp.AAC.1